MAEKYLGEQGLSKLIELVKKNSGGSPIYIKSRKAPLYFISTSLTQGIIRTFLVNVSNPIAIQNLMVTVYWDGTRSNTSFSQLCAFSENGLWITEVYMVAQSSRVDINATLFYIGPDENAIDNGNFTINSAKTIGDV